MSVRLVTDSRSVSPLDSLPANSDPSECAALRLRVVVENADVLSDEISEVFLDGRINLSDLLAVVELFVVTIETLGEIVYRNPARCPALGTDDRYFRGVLAS